MNAVNDNPHDDQPAGGHALAAIVLAAVVALAYGSCVTGMVACADDYWLLWQWREDPPRVLEVWNKAGRVVNAALFSVLWRDAVEIGDLWRPRLAAIVGIYLLAAGIFATMRRMEYSWWISLAFAGLTTLLPTFGVYAAWATCSGHVFACLASLAAFAIADAGWRSRPWWLLAVAAVGGMTLEAAALCIYQPAGMFYVVPCMLALASRSMTPWSSAAGVRTLIHAGVLVAGIAIGFLVFKASAGEAQEIDLRERAAVTTDPIKKAGRFVAQPLAQSCLPFFFVGHWSNAARGAMAVVVLGVLVPLGMLSRLEGSGAGRLLRILALLALVPVSYLPNLFVAADFFPYRTRAAIAPAVLLLLVLAAAGGIRFLVADPSRRRFVQQAVVVGALVVGLIAARQHVTRGFIVPSQMEWAIVRLEVLREASRQPRPERIVFLMPDSSRPLTGRFVYDEFGYVSSSHEWTCRGMTGLAVADVAPQSLEALRTARFVELKFGQNVPTADNQGWIIDARRINDLAPRPEGSP